MDENNTSSMSISIVIPTFNRGPLLINTIRDLLSIPHPANEIVVIDQTRSHPPEVARQLSDWEQDGSISLTYQPTPSVVKAMNLGLVTAKEDYVLFLDDDIKPCYDLIEKHWLFAISRQCDVVAGRVIQPWNDPNGDQTSHDVNRSYNALDNCQTEHFIGANFLVKRETAIQVGGFDENFKGTAHDYEREFSDRVQLNAGQIFYCGEAAVHHLKEPNGGIRTFGHFLKTAKPHHALGAYYYILRSKRVKSKGIKIIRRLLERIFTRTHLKQPWWIPVTLLGDILGLLWAISLSLSPPKLLKKEHVNC